jgi:UDP-N-acetyl-D-glucosamine dehydrogenase
VELTDDVIEHSDALVIITDHRAVDYGRLVDKGHLIIDTRNALSKFGSGRARVVTLAARRSD